jgi:NitT/TauT family transport system substrate-binding protein
MNRRELIGAALGLAVGAAPRNVFAQSVQRFRAAATPIEGDSLLWLAQSEGYFARAGIQLDVQALGSGDATAAAIVGGDITIGSMNTLSLATAHQNGADFKIVAAGAQFVSGRGVLVLMVKADSPITSGTGLSGKTIAVNVLHGSGQIAAEAWVDKHGGDSKSVQWAEIPFGAMQAALESGHIDAAAIAQPWATAALTTCRSLGVPNDAIAPRFLIGSYVASGSWIAANADAARRIRSALSKCAHWYNTDPGASTQAVAVLTKQDPAVVGKSARTIFGETVTPALVQPLIDVGARYGILKSRFAAADIIALL